MVLYDVCVDPILTFFMHGYIIPQLAAAVVDVD